jgi:hypothetical protein
MNVALIVGIEMRSGTNYLYSLLAKHKQIQCSTDTAEDFIIAQSAYLRKFISVLWQAWERYKPRVLSFELLASKAEEFVHSMLDPMPRGSRTDTVIVSKTPTTLSIDELPTLFNKTKIIFLVRDGRSLACSLEKSFSISHFEALLRWKRGAANILKFIKVRNDYFTKNCLLIRYEDLVVSSADELRRVFEFLQVSDSDYNYANVAETEIIGSSELVNSEGKVHWEPRKRNAQFLPNARYQEWPRWKQTSAACILHDELRELGYVDQNDRNALVAIFWRLCFQCFRAVRALMPKAWRPLVKGWFLK